MSDSSYIIPSSSHSPQPSQPLSPSNSGPSSPSEIDSLPSSPTTSTIQNTSDEEDAEEEGETDAEREWKESLQQLELLLTMVVVPYVGKYFGRKCAYWGWARFMEWKYPDVEVVVTNKRTFKGAGAVEAAASL